MGGSVIYFLLIFFLLFKILFLFLYLVLIRCLNQLYSVEENTKIKTYTYKTDKPVLIIASIIYLYFVLLIIRVFSTIWPFDSVNKFVFTFLCALWGSRLLFTCNSFIWVLFKHYLSTIRKNLFSYLSDSVY